MFGNLQSGDDDRRTEPPFRQKQARAVKLFALVATLGVAALFVAYWVGRPMLSKWRFERDIKQAERYEKDGDFRSAMLLLEQVNRLHPTQADVRRRLAGFYERAGQVESVTIWKEAVELDPANPESRLGLARAAVRFGDLGTARKALDGWKDQSSHPVEFHRLMAGLAVLEKNPRSQEEHLAALERLDPADPRIRLNLAALRLAHPQGPLAGEARDTLLALARGDQVRIRAVVELLSDVARRWPQPTPERAAALKTLADTLAPARGPLVELPSRVDHIDRLVAYAMTQPNPSAEDAVSLANWMSLNGHTESALQWIDALPASLARTPLVLGAVAELAVRAKDWTRLQALLRGGAWGVVPAEAVEQAFRARRSHGLPGRAGTLSAWSAAIEAARTSPAALRMLLRLAEIWEWPGEYRQVLQAIARNLPRENWAWRQLISHALVHGESDQLWQVYQEWRRAVPGDPVVQVEAAIMGLLLQRRPVPSIDEAAALVRREPGGPGAAVAHALALWRGGRVAEAAAVLDAVPTAAFGETRYALVRGLVLADAGRARESAALIEKASADLLLPEERALVEQARARNRGAPPPAR